MIKLFFLGIFLLGIIIFSGVFVSAGIGWGTSCSDNQIIIKLSAGDNALGASYDKIVSYDGNICYSILFGNPFTYASGDPHTCNGNNRILFIYPNPDGKGYIGADELYNSAYDVDGNGINDEKDYQQVINCALGDKKPACDLDKDGDIDASDVQLSVNCLLGSPETGCGKPLVANTVLNSNPEYKPNYDLDNDGNVDAGDLQNEINCVMNLISPECNKADLNGDGKIDSTDLQYMINYKLGIISYTEICYGDMQCRVTTTGSCNADEKATLSLDKRTDSLISSLATHPLLICCKSPQGANIFEICDNRIDDDNDPYIDYNDVIDCPAKKCTDQGKAIKYPVGGTGSGAPWTPFDKYSDTKGCCLTNQCYSGNPSFGGCFNSGGIQDFSSPENSKIHVCSVSGSSAVWCNQTTFNDGTGNCVCPAGIDANGKCIDNSFISANCIPGFIANVEYYHPFGGGRIVGWNSGGQFTTWNGNAWSALASPNGVGGDGKIPTGFKPTVGYYHSFNGGKIVLWNSNGEFIIYNGVSWSVSTLPSGGAGNIPAGFKPTVGYYHSFNGGGIVLWNANGEFINYNGISWGGLTKPNGVGGDGRIPAWFKPTVGFYSAFGGGKVVLQNASGSIITWNSASWTAPVCGESEITLPCPSGEQLCPDNICRVNCETGDRGEPQSCGDFDSQPDCNNPELLTNNILSNIQDRTGLEGDACLDSGLTREINGCEVYTKCGCAWNAFYSICEGEFKNIKANPADTCINFTPDVDDRCLITYNYSASADCANNNEYKLSWKSRWVSTGTENPDNGCISGSTVVACPTKSYLPFFGFFNFIIAGLMIGGVYFFLRKNKLSG